MAEKQTFLTGVGRIVQGHPLKGNTSDRNNRPLTDGQGNPRTEYFIGVAFPKDDPKFNELYTIMYQTAQAAYPDGAFNDPDFSWKMKDGDGVDSMGQSYSNREGFAGHWVIGFKTSFMPTVYTAGGASQIVDPEQIKRGDYVRVYGSTQANGNVRGNKPGIYMNMNMVELVGYGEAITSGPDGAAVFGGEPAGQLPPGASTMPTAGTPLAAPGTPQQPPAAPAAPGMPQQPQAAPAAPGMPQQPQAAPAAPGMPQQPAPPSYLTGGNG